MNTTDRKHTARRPLPLLLAAALMCLLAVACDKDIHDGEYPLPDGQGALVIGLESPSEVTGLTVSTPARWLPNTSRSMPGATPSSSQPMPPAPRCRKKPPLQTWRNG